MQNSIKQILQEPKRTPPKVERKNSLLSHEINYSIIWLSIIFYGAVDISDLFDDTLES